MLIVALSGMIIFCSSFFFFLLIYILRWTCIALAKTEKQVFSVGTNSEAPQRESKPIAI